MLLKKLTPSRISLYFSGGASSRLAEAAFKPVEGRVIFIFCYLQRPHLLWGANKPLQHHGWLIWGSRLINGCVYKPGFMFNSCIMSWSCFRASTYQSCLIINREKCQVGPEGACFFTAWRSVAMQVESTLFPLHLGMMLLVPLCLSLILTIIKMYLWKQSSPSWV